jgi:hypothetical protein
MEAIMGYPTKVQLIKRKQSEQWYINFPAAVAQAMDFKKGEVCHWVIEDRELLVLQRQNPPDSLLKKKQRKGSSQTSKKSGNKAGKPSARTGSVKGR